MTDKYALTLAAAGLMLAATYIAFLGWHLTKQVIAEQVADGKNPLLMAVTVLFFGFAGAASWTYVANRVLRIAFP